MRSPALQAEGLGFWYVPQLPVLEGLCLAVNEDERLGIVGANAAGKSTLLRLFAGVMPPRAGRLTVKGTESRPESLAAIRRHAGLVFQDPDDMLFMPTVRADVAFGPASRGLEPRAVEARVQAALAATRASGLEERPPWGLSGGEKRAVAIAAALALEPSILLLDEPSSGLDPASRRELIHLLPTLPGTLIVASHDLDLVLDVCDRVVVLGHRRITADGPAQSVLRDRDLLAANRLELPLRLQSCPICNTDPSPPRAERRPENQPFRRSRTSREQGRP